ncbi:hypothetical protein GCM10020331_048880 [Ectobacillus funiculus]
MPEMKKILRHPGNGLFSIYYAFEYNRRLTLALGHCCGAYYGCPDVVFLIDRTALGYELKAVGFNTHASQYAGMKVSRNIVLSMSIAGAFAGIGGAMEGLGTFQNMTAMSSFTGIGFDGIAVALLGGNNAFGILLAALLFGGLKKVLRRK